MERIRIIYSKSKDAVYFEPKDLICIFEKSLERSGVKINYKNGRPNFTFAYPLDIGVESTYEIMDAVIEDMVPVSFFIKELNNKLPPGIACLYADYVNFESKNISSSVFASVYIVNFIYDDNLLKSMTNAEIKAMKEKDSERFKDYLKQDEIRIKVKDSLSEDLIDVKRNIQDYTHLMDICSFEVTVDTGERASISILDLMNGFNRFLGKDMAYNIKRTKILYK